MRVVTGSAKGRKLQSVPGDSTRPITDRAKVSLFNILGEWIVGTRVLDLFGGTGGVGIECLSRGTAFVQFLELNRKAAETIQANLRHTQLDAFANVLRGDSFAFLQNYRPGQDESFNLIYLAPPQYQGMWSKALQMIDARPELLAAGGTVIVQIHPREYAELSLAHLEQYDQRKYGSVMLVFYAAQADVNEALAEGEEEDEEEAEE